METNQPIWNCVAALGDVHPLEYGGQLVFIDRTGKYAPEMEIIQPDDETENHVKISRLILEPHTFENGVLSDNPSHPNSPAWYADKIDDVAGKGGRSKDDLIQGLTGNDPVEKAHCYWDLVSYFGPFEFDQYPIRLTIPEAKKRYRSIFRRGLAVA